MPESDRDSNDLVDSMIERFQEGTPDRLARQMSEAEIIKAHEEAGSQRRLEEMWKQEHERQRKITESQARRKQQEEQIVRYVLIAAGIFIAIVIVAVLVISGSG